MQWGYWTNGWRLVPLSLDLSWFSPFLRTLAPFRGIVGVFGSVFVCVCLLGWVFLLDVLGWMFIPFLFGHCWIFGSSNRESKSKVKSPVHSYECNHLYEWMGCVVWFHTPAVDPTERLWGWTSSSFGELVERIPWFSDWFQLSPPHSLTLLVSTANMLEWRSFWRVCTHTHTLSSGLMFSVEW